MIAMRDTLTEDDWRRFGVALDRVTAPEILKGRSMTYVGVLVGGDGYWYLGSPYSKWKGGIDDAWNEICKIAADLVRARVRFYCPIAHTHWIARVGNIDPLDHEIWLPVDQPIAHGAKGMIVAGMRGWQASYGIGEEIKWFRAAGKPVWLLDPLTLTVEAL